MSGASCVPRAAPAIRRQRHFAGVPCTTPKKSRSAELDSDRVVLPRQFLHMPFDATSIGPSTNLDVRRGQQLLAAAGLIRGE